MVTSRMCISSMTRRITSMGQGDPAMMPVRSDVRSKLLEIGMVEFGDEHGGHAVERGAFLVLHRLQHRQRLEAFRRIDHRGAMRQAAEIAHHHAEAMIERHGNAEAVVRRQADLLADEEAVVQDVAMAKAWRLWESPSCRW